MAPERTVQVNSGIKDAEKENIFLIAWGYSYLSYLKGSRSSKTLPNGDGKLVIISK